MLRGPLLGRQFQDLGHNVKVVPTHYIKMELNNPNKGFFNDARVIAAATIRTNIPEVPIKSVEQLEANSIYRMYTQCLRDRNSVCNLTWQMLTEQGVNIPKGLQRCAAFCLVARRLCNGSETVFAEFLKSPEAVDRNG